MPIKPKYFLYGAGALIVAGVIYGVSRTVHTGNNLDVKLLPKIKRWGFDTVDVELDAWLKNPTGGSIQVHDLQVGLYHNDPKRKNPITAPLKVPGTVTIPAKFEGPLSHPDVYGRKLLISPRYAEVLAIAGPVVNAWVGNGPATAIDVVAPMEVESPTMLRTPFTFETQIPVGKA